MNKEFDREKFYNWMGEAFGLDRFRDSYSFQLIENIVEYALKNECISLDQFPEFVSDMLPEVEFLEVARFCGNNMLTDTTIKELRRKN